MICLAYVIGSTTADDRGPVSSAPAAWRETLSRLSAGRSGNFGGHSGILSTFLEVPQASGSNSSFPLGEGRQCKAPSADSDKDSMPTSTDKPPRWQQLKRLRARLAGDPEPTVEIPFELNCECGATVDGVRRSTAIQKDCEICGSVLFVLPVNIYPATPSVASEVIGGSFSHRLRVVIGELLGRPRPDTSAGSKAAAAKAKSQSDATDETTADTEAAGESAARGLLTRLRGWTLPRFDVRRAIRTTFTPFRLMMLAIISVVGLTGHFLSQQQSQDAAQQVWLDAAEQIEGLLVDRDFVALEASLDEAVTAGRTLGKSDREWRHVCNLLLESRGANSLAAVDLLSAFQDAYADDGTINSTGVGLVEYAADSGVYVFDSWVRPDYVIPGAYRCELPAAPGRHFVHALLPIPELEAYVQAAEEKRVLFAARIGSVQPPGTANGNAWRLALEGDSFVLLTAPEIVEAVGFDVLRDQQLATLLQEQDAFIRESETWAQRETMTLQQLLDGNTVQENTVQGETP